MAPDIYAYLEKEIQPWLERLGYHVKIYPNSFARGGPFLVGKRIETADSQFPTVLTYGHADVVRGMATEWRAGLNPWEVKQEGDRIYGRGTVDNKGQHAVAITALEAVIKVRGRLGFNSIVLIESSEEIGSLGINEFVHSHRDELAADVLIASDGPRVAVHQPTLFLGSRGAINFDLSVALRKSSNHSGNWGGILANPAVILSHAISSIISLRGEILLQELKPHTIPESVKQALEGIAIEPGADSPNIDHYWGEPGLSTVEKLFAWSSFDVLALTSGNPENPENAVPPRASAHCQIRFTVDTDPETFMPALRRHLDANGLDMVSVRESVDRKRWIATRMNPDHPWVHWTAASIERTIGRPPAILPNYGASLPNDVFANVLGLATIWIPHSYAGCSQHAPNEHGLASLFREALHIMGGIFWDMGEAPPDNAAVRNKACV